MGASGSRGIAVRQRTNAGLGGLRIVWGGTLRLGGAALSCQSDRGIAEGFAGVFGGPAGFMGIDGGGLGASRSIGYQRMRSEGRLAG